MRRLLSLLVLGLLLVPEMSFAVYTRLPVEHHYAETWPVMIKGSELKGVKRDLMNDGSNRATQEREIRRVQDFFEFPMPALFSDVPETHPNFEAIKYVASQGILGAVTGREFKPDQLMTRGELTRAVTDRVFSEWYIEECFKNISFPSSPDYALLFKDMAKEGEDAKRICAALMAGVVHGYDDGMFRKDQPINFAEASKILTRTYDVSFLPYRGEGVEWFKLYVMSLVENAGIPLSIRKFDSAVTRAEAAEMIYRIDAGITNRPSKTYKQLMASTGWFLLSVLDSAAL